MKALPVFHFAFQGPKSCLYKVYSSMRDPSSLELQQKHEQPLLEKRFAGPDLKHEAV